MYVFGAALSHTSYGGITPYGLGEEMVVLFYTWTGWQSYG